MNVSYSLVVLYYARQGRDTPDSTWSVVISDFGSRELAEDVGMSLKYPPYDYKAPEKQWHEVAVKHYEVIEVRKAQRDE